VYRTEGSLEETKRLVRRKLQLASDADVGLEQWRAGRLIDLEDGMSFVSLSPFVLFYGHSYVFWIRYLITLLLLLGR